MRKIVLIQPKTCALSISLALSLFFHSCTSSATKGRQLKPVTLQVAIQPFLTVAPFVIAEAEGYFAEQGLQVEFVNMNRSTSAIPALAQGKLDVVSGTITLSLLNAMARGARIKIVSDNGYAYLAGCGSNALLARRALVQSGELGNPSQLAGRRIALTRFTFKEYYVDQLLGTAGLTLDDVEIVDIPNAARLEALQKGQVDLVEVTEPWRTHILEAGHAVLWTADRDVVPDFQIGVIMYGSSLLDENPDAGRRFMVAHLKAVRQYNQGKTKRNMEIIAAYTKLDRNFLKQACWSTKRDDGRINIESVLQFQAWAVEKGYLDRPVSRDQFWGHSFVDYANRTLDGPSR